MAFRALAILILAGTVSATASNIGASCCADLDARIAHKGNRNVALEVSDLVNTGLLAWDDGAEDNTYVVTNDNERSRFRFVGKAAIDAMWEAGYRIEVGIRSANSKLVNQIADGG